MNRNHFARPTLLTLSLIGVLALSLPVFAFQDNRVNEPISSALDRFRFVWSGGRPTGDCLCRSNAQPTGYANTKNEIKSYVEQAIEKELIVGAAVAVVQGDKTVLLHCDGLADCESGREVSLDTVFYIASSTKSFTGLATAICDQRGELNLDQTLDTLLPRVEFHPDITPSSISLRDLLIHTHGINNNGPVSFRSAFSGQHTAKKLKELMKFHGASPQGRDFHYGNIGYNIAGLAIQDQLAMSWKELLHREIFAPLAMESTSGFVSRVDRNHLAYPHGVVAEGFERLHYAKSDDNMHAAGGLVTTIDDLAIWLKANINQGQVNGKQLIPKSVFETAHHPHAKQAGKSVGFNATGYGLGWNRGTYKENEILYHHGGFSGFHCHISFAPDQKVGVAILVNSNIGFLFADALSRLVYDHLVHDQEIDDQSTSESLDKIADPLARYRTAITADRARRAARPQQLPHPLSAYAGIYENELDGQIQISVVEDRLEASMGPLWSRIEAYNAQENALRIELTGRGHVAQFSIQEGKPADHFIMNGSKFVRVESTQVDRNATNKVLSVGDTVSGLQIPVLLQAEDREAVAIEELRGSTIVLEFWATWCGPCIAAIEHVNQVADDSAREDNVVFISMTDEDSETVANFLEQKPIHTWIGIDQKKSFLRAFGIRAIPQTIIINSDGKVAAKIAPAQLDQEILQRVKKGELIQADTRSSPAVIPGMDPESGKTKQPLMQLILRESTSPTTHGTESDGNATLVGYTARQVISKMFSLHPTRTIFEGDLPEGRYDLIAYCPNTSSRQFVNAAIAAAFDVAVRKERRRIEVTIVRQSKDEQHNLKPTASTGGSSTTASPKGINVINGTVSTILNLMEAPLGQIVMDETGLQGSFDIKVDWSESSTPSEIAKQFAEATGLQLTTEQREVEITIVEHR